MNLKRALEACLFGVGLAGGRGLLDAVVPDGDEIGFTPSSSSTRATGTTEARQACALMRGLVEEGTRIRDLLLVLVGMYREREPLLPTSSPAIPMDSGRLTGAQVVATVQSACDFRRRTLAAVVGAFVGWLADTPWVWGATEGVEGEDWEGDFEAAAMATFVVFPTPGAACADEGICTAGLVERVRSDVRESCPYNQDSSGEGQPRNVSVGSCSVDPTEVLDRLVAGAAMAMGRVDADEVEWLDVLRRVAIAGAASDALKTYAIACVERSASLGGQAPFMVRGKRRFSQVGGKELWGLLQEACLVHEEKMPASLLVRTAAAVVTASRKTWCALNLLLRHLTGLGNTFIEVYYDAFADVHIGLEELHKAKSARQSGNSICVYARESLCIHENWSLLRSLLMSEPPPEQSIVDGFPRAARLESHPRGD